MGERSGLIIGPSGVVYTVTSSDPETVAVERVLTFWIAVAKAEGSAEITASNSTGEYGTVTLTVGSTSPAASEAPAVDAGYPYGFGSNLTVFTGTADAAQRAIDNWINSPGHFQTMIDPRCDCIGVGVTQYDGITYCYMFVGVPNNVNFYA